METNKSLQVLYKDTVVGTLALTEDRKAAFEYADEWIEHGFSISPFSLPLEKKVFIPGKTHFNGLYGVFADSLPDAWGRLLLERLLKKHGIDRDQITVLDRLAIVGDSGMGALSYRPDMKLEAPEQAVDFDELAEQCHKILTTEYNDNIDELYGLGGTSGGARPKIMTEIDGEAWIIKFPAHIDGENAGRMEYDYSLCAKECGITMTETRLLPSKRCSGYFGTKRFDRASESTKQTRVHMCTAAALLELDFEQPSLDYHELMKLTRIMTEDCKEDLENMFLRMCFNVFAHNRDDHSKNFSYIYDEVHARWRLSPAYDMTYSNTYYGEHTTSVDGNGRNPGEKELLAVGIAAGMKKTKCQEMMRRVKVCVETRLGKP